MRVIIPMGLLRRKLSALVLSTGGKAGRDTRSDFRRLSGRTVGRWTQIH